MEIFERNEIEVLKNELVDETMTVLALSEKLIDLNFEDIYDIGYIVDSILNTQTLAISDEYLLDFEVISINRELYDLLEDKDAFKLDINLEDLELAKIKINDICYL